MKKLLLGVTVAAALGFMAGPVSAADLPVKAPPVVMPALYNWSGVYIGIEGGAIAGQNSDWHFLNVTGVLLVATGLPNQPGTLCGTPFSFPGNCSNAGHPMHGGFAGGEIGFNWQPVGSRWVVGIEADGNWSELEEALICAAPFGVNESCGSRIRDFETVRGRLGYAFGPRGDFLAYVTGGWATASQSAFETTLVAVAQPNGTATFPRFEQWQRTNGFIVGGGFEYGITSWLSVKGEVAYVWLQGKDYCFPEVGPIQPGFLAGGCTAITPVVISPFGTLFDVIPAHVHDDFILFRMGLNARLWWGKAPTPVVASY